MICTNSDDPYLSSRYYSHAMWVVSLSNDLIVYMDNDNPAYEEKSAWIRLKKYCSENKVKIKSLTLQFRSHIIKPVPDNASGYYFRSGLMGFPTGANVGFFLVGFLQNEKIQIVRIGVPELLPIEKEIRNVNDEVGVGPSLIRNNDD